MREAIIVLSLLVYMVPAYSIVVTITPEESQAIGKKIWHNECKGTIEGLTTWNQGEKFASLGIGHFIWYPAGKKKIFNQTFPSLVTYLKKHGTALPPWLEKSIRTGCPWKTRAAFIAAQDSNQMNELRALLQQSIDLQTQFMVERFMAVVQSDAMREKLTNNAYAHLYALTQTAQGLYALIDYVNFKGAGLSTYPEKYRGKGWGLLQVLETIDHTKLTTKPIEQFAHAAKMVLMQRVKHAPKELNEQRWIPGWFKRIDTYTALD